MLDFGQRIAELALTQRLLGGVTLDVVIKEA